MSYLILEALEKSFPARDGSGRVLAVDRIDLAVKQGEFVTLLGPSGCGKTTTLRMIAGFEHPTHGRIVLDGETINDKPPNRRNMAMVFQSYALFPHLRVFENVAYGLRLRRLPEAEIRARVMEALALAGLGGLEQRAPNQLSGGQQQRVALARALVLSPKVLLMDEPLSNLDAKLREQMRAEIRRIQQTLGITTIYVTHDQAEAMTLSDRTVVMNQGRIEQVAPPRVVYERPASRFVADFIGRSNFLPATVQGTEGETLCVSVLGRTLRVPHSASAARLEVGQPATLLLRPEALSLGTEGQFAGTVQHATYLGGTVEYVVQLADGQLVTVLDADPLRPRIFDAGDAVRVALLEPCLYLLPDPPQAA